MFEADVKVTSNIFWLLVDKLITLFTSAISIFVVANYFGAKEYGLYQYAISIVAILELITQTIDGRVIKKHYKHKCEYDNGIVGNVIFYKAVFSVILLIVVMAFQFVHKTDYKGTTIILILLIEGLLKNIRYGIENRFEYQLESKKIVIALDIAVIVGLCLQLVVVYEKESIIYLALCQLFATMIGTIALSILYLQRFSIKGFTNINISFLKDIFRESLPLSLAMMASVIYTKCDSVMLGMFMSTKEVGIYYLASRIVSAAQILIVPIQTTIYIKLIDLFQDSDKYKKYYLWITSISTWLAIIIVALSFLILPFIFVFLKDEYHPALGVYHILAIGIIFNYNAILRSSHFTLIKQGHILLKTQIVMVFMNIVMNIVFIKYFGMQGAAIATICAQVLSLFVSNIFFEDAKYVLKQQVRAFNPRYVLLKRDI